MPLGNESFLTKEFPGPQNLQQWLASWRVFKVAAISLGIVSLAALQQREKLVERLILHGPQAWGLIVLADDKGRAERPYTKIGVTVRLHNAASWLSVASSSSSSGGAPIVVMYL